MENFMNVGMIEIFALLIFSIIALYFDIKYKKIPNRLNVIFLILGIFMHLHFRNEILNYLFINLFFIFVVGILLKTIKVFAMGDVKYYMVNSVIIGFHNCLEIMFLTIILGVPLGCIYVITQQGLKYTFQKIRINLLHLLILPLKENQLSRFPLMIACFPATFFWILIQMNGVEQLVPFNFVFPKILNFTAH
jgi:prepilin peptidase CpaA